MSDIAPAQGTGGSTSSGGGGGGKLLVGCMVAAGVVTVLGGTGVVLGLKWFAGKAQETVNELSPVDLSSKAESKEPKGLIGSLTAAVAKRVGGKAATEDGDDAVAKDAYEPPKDGVMDEDRLKVFLEVRRDVVTMYKSFEGDAKDLKESKSADLLKGMKGLKMLANIKKKHRAALADKGMPEGEYAWYAGTVYGALVGKAAGLMEPGGGKTIAEGLSAMTELMDTGELTDKQKKELEKSRKKLEKIGRKAAEYPKENLALVDKYQLDIKELAVPALDSIFFTGPSAWKHAFPFKALADD